MKSKRWCISLLIYLVFVASVVTGVSFSRFSTTLANTGAENTQLPPDIEFSTWILTHEAASVPLEGLQPGSVREIPVTISNYNSEGVSGYDQSVYLVLDTTGNLPLVFELTGEDGLNLEQMTMYHYKSSAIQFTAGVKETKSLTLSVIWPDDMRDYRYMDEIDYLELRLEAVQSVTPAYTTPSYIMPQSAPDAPETPEPQDMAESQRVDGDWE